MVAYGEDMRPSARVRKQGPFNDSQRTHRARMETRTRQMQRRIITMERGKVTDDGRAPLGAGDAKARAVRPETAR